jgi:hypothetical protein
MSDTNIETVVAPVYLPWKTFSAYIVSLKDTTVPHTLDNTVKPSNMAGGVWRHLTSALQFLGLLDSQKVVKDALGKLVKAHGTPEWGAAIKECLLPAYAKIVDGLPLARATSGQLEKCFKGTGNVQGQMLEKAIRFYLHALKEAGVKYSDHLMMRKGKTVKAGGSKQKSAKIKTAAVAEEKTDKDTETNHSEKLKGGAPQGMISFPLHFKGKPAGEIRVHKDLNNEDVALIELTVNVIKAYAGQKDGN